MAIRDISTHIERAKNAAKNVNEVNLSKTEKGRGLDHVQETLARRQRKFSIIKILPCSYNDDSIQSIICTTATITPNILLFRGNI